MVPSMEERLVLAELSGSEMAVCSQHNSDVHPGYVHSWPEARLRILHLQTHSPGSVAVTAESQGSIPSSPMCSPS